MSTFVEGTKNLKSKNGSFPYLWSECGKRPGLFGPSEVINRQSDIAEFIGRSSR